MKKGIGKQKWSGKISRDIIDKVLMVFLNKTYKNVTIHFSGGEPLICLDEIDYICTQAKTLCSRELRFAMSTNGTLINEDSINIINKHHINTVISIDGFGNLNSHRRDNFGNETIDKVIEGYYELKASGASVGLSLVATHMNLKHIDEIMHKITEEMKPDSIGLNYLHYPGFDKSLAQNMAEMDLENYAKALYNVYEQCRQHGIFEEQSNRVIEPFVLQRPRLAHCSSQTSQLTVSPNGAICPCKTFLTRGVDTLEMDDWEKCEEMKDIVELKKWRRRTVDNINKCSSCAVRYLCGGGCGYEAFVETGSIQENSDRYCIVPRYMLIKLLELLDSMGKFSDADDTIKWLPKSERTALLSVPDLDNLKLTTSIGHILE